MVFRSKKRHRRFGERNTLRMRPERQLRRQSMPRIETRIERVAKRDSANIEEIRQRMANQTSDDEKINKADFVVKNYSNNSVISQVLELMVKAREEWK